MEENNNIIVLQDEDGKNIDCEVIDVFELNGVMYFALVLAEPQNEEEESDLMLMRVEGEGDDLDLISIESEAELQDAFDEFLRREEEAELEE